MGSGHSVSRTSRGWRQPAEGHAWVVVALVYAIPFFAFPTGWFGDDGGVLEFAQRNARSTASDIFFYRDHGMERYRPLTQGLASLSYALFETDALLIRIASYAAFVTAAWALYAIARSVVRDSFAPVLALAWFACTPLKIQALFRPGRPEIFVTAFSLLAILCICKAFTHTSRVTSAAILSAAVLFGLVAALWSETGSSTFLVMALWIAVLAWRGRSPTSGMAALLYPAAGLSAYSAWYLFVDAPLPDDAATRYRIQLGDNVLRNIALALAGTVSPLATPTVMRLWTNHADVLDAVAVAVGVGMLGVVLPFVVRALRRDRPGCSVIWLFVGSAVLSLFPFVLIGHVSEVYVTQAAAYMSGGIGVALATSLHMATGASKMLLRSSLTLLAVVMIYTSADALGRLRHNSQVFATLHADLVNVRRQEILHVLLLPPCVTLRFSQYYLTYEDIFTYRGGDIPRVSWLGNCSSLDVAPTVERSFYVEPDGRLRPVVF